MKKRLLIPLLIAFIPIFFLGVLPMKVQALELQVPQDELYLYYTGIVDGNPLTVDTVYEQIDSTYYSGSTIYSSTVYNCESYWNVNKNNRVISSTSGTCVQPAGSHDIFWIIVDSLDLHDYVSICMDGYGDYVFEVLETQPVTAMSQEIQCYLLYNTFSNSSMLYDVESGLLIWGKDYNISGTVFHWLLEDYDVPSDDGPDGDGNSLEDFFKSIPGYEHILIITGISICFILIMFRKKFKLNK